VDGSICQLSRCDHDAVRPSGGREALVGVVISGAFGIAWAQWAATGLGGLAATAVRLGGLAVGALLVGLAAVRFLRRATGPAGAGGASMFASRSYRIVVAAEVIALFGGNIVLNGIGRNEYVPVWTALVVGVHFIGLGRSFSPIFHWISGGFVVAAVAGLAESRSGATAITTTTGLVAALTLFLAGAAGLTLAD
jgi:hypothetical protein